MSEAEPTIPFLHTRYLSRCQQKACNKNPTYRGRLTGLHTIRNELHRLRDLLAVRETGELGLMPRNSLKKTLRLGARDSLALQLQQQRATQEEDALVKRIRADYQVQEQRMLEWDDQCAALAESLLAKPKFHVGDEVRCVDGHWCWVLPSGSLVIPRHFPCVQPLLPEVGEPEDGSFPP